MSDHADTIRRGLSEYDPEIDVVREQHEALDALLAENQGCIAALDSLETLLFGDCFRRSWDEMDDQAQKVVAENQRLRDALITMRTLALCANEGDPWYAENEGIDSEAIFKQAREALAGDTE